MTTTTTYDGEGNVTGIEVKPNTVTVSYGRKVPRDGGFGANEEASVFSQVEVTPEDTPESIETKVKEAFAFNKAIVAQQLGLLYGVDEATGVVRVVEVEPPAKPAGKSFPRKGGGKPAAQTGGPKKSNDELWAQYQEDPSRWWDNRDDKRNPKAPDFKHKDTGDGLWLDSAPEGLFDGDFVGDAVI